MKGIRGLTQSDCEQVLRLNAGSLPGVARLDEAEFARLVTLPNAHLAVEGPARNLIGYLLAFSSSSAYDGEEFLTFAKSCREPFLYIDQVAVDPGMRRAGIASALYEALEAHAQSRSIFGLCCEVNLNPLNPGSLAFHQDAGFKQLGVLKTAGGRTVALMTKSVKSAELGARET